MDRVQKPFKSRFFILFDDGRKSVVDVVRELGYVV